jgi:hypothetical protein
MNCFSLYALGLTACCTYAINALNNCPEESAVMFELAWVALPHTDEEENENIVWRHKYKQIDGAPVRDLETDRYPYCPHGAFFINSLVCDDRRDTPQLGVQRTISAAYIEELFGKSYMALRAQYETSGVLTATDIPSSRVPTCKKHTQLQIPVTEAEVAQVAFNMEGLGFEAPGREPYNEDEPDTALHHKHAEFSLDVQLTTILRTLWVDLIKKMPNRQGRTNATYCYLDEKERRIGVKLFQRADLGNVWRFAQWRYADAADWTDILDNLFPNRGNMKPVGTQNYPSMAYYNAWTDWTNRSTSGAIAAVKKQIHAIFEDILWVPYVVKDRVWDTHVQHSLINVHPVSHPGAALIIIINPKMNPESGGVGVSWVRTA